MRSLYFNKAFKARQDKRVETFPDIEGFSFREVVDEEYDFNITGRQCCFALMEKDPYAGLCEVVYAIHYNKRSGRNEFQKIMVIPERRSVPLIRNCYYRWGGMAQGFYVYGFDGKGRRCSDFDFAYSPDFDFMDEDFPLERIYYNESYIDARVLAELDPSLQYCAYDGESGVKVVDYIRLYRKHPKVCEMLMKYKLYRFINEKAIEMLESNLAFLRWVARNAREISSSHMAPRTAFNAYKKNPSGDPSDYAHSLACRCAVGREIAFSNKEVYHKALKYATQERILRYQEEQNISSQSYGDYLIACDWLRLDFSDTKVLFPHNFREMHDNYTTQYFEWVSNQEKNKAKKEAATLNLRMASMAKKFAFLGDFSLDGICVVVAKSKMELIDEGAALHHCVGKMGYDKRQARGESIICFIRKTDEPFTPYVTAEVKVTAQQLRIVQCYGDRDKQVPELAGFTAAWMKAVNKEYRKRAELA